MNRDGRDDKRVLLLQALGLGGAVILTGCMPEGMRGNKSVKPTEKAAPVATIPVPKSCEGDTSALNPGTLSRQDYVIYPDGVVVYKASSVEVSTNTGDLGKVNHNPALGLNLALSRSNIIYLWEGSLQDEQGRRAVLDLMKTEYQYLMAEHCQLMRVDGATTRFGLIPIEDVLAQVIAKRPKDSIPFNDPYYARSLSFRLLLAYLGVSRLVAVDVDRIPASLPEVAREIREQAAQLGSSPFLVSRLDPRLVAKVALR